jgi:hypothetical protein
MRRIQIIHTPTGDLSMIRSVAEALLREGVITGALDSELKARDATLVKAAVMQHAICDFCSVPGPSHVLDVPDFELAPGHRSTDGWSACDECHALILAGKRKQLLVRSEQSISFAKFTKGALVELHDRFWQAKDVADSAVRGVDALRAFIETGAGLEPTLKEATDRALRVAHVATHTGLSIGETEQVLTGEIGGKTLEKLISWVQHVEKGQRAPIAADPPDLRKPLADVVPHWQRALDAKFGALTDLRKLLAMGDRAIFIPRATNLADPQAVENAAREAKIRTSLADLGFDKDLRYLQTAQAYSFNTETTAAIREAARGIPIDAPLSSIETPNTGSGWFWFGEPLPIAASSLVNDQVNALLWGWERGAAKRVSYSIHLTDEMAAKVRETDPSLAEELDRADALYGRMMNWDSATVTRLGHALRRGGVMAEELDAVSERHEEEGEPSLMFSAYVLDVNGVVLKGRVLPSTRWHWPFGMSIEEMLDYNGRLYDRPKSEDSREIIATKDETLAVVKELSLFFAMACVWFRQTVPGTQRKIEPVLTRSEGAIERHARKRFEREHKLSERPTVQVVALRKTMRTPAENAPADRAAGARNYQCRWIVQGHPRMQVCGPGRKDRKLIWIEAHPAGPADKPLRTKEKVYAVVR